jgi:hypothetical protein
LYPVQDYRQSDWFEQLVVNPDSVTEETEGIIENEWIIQLKQESLKNLYSVSKAADYLDDYGVTVLAGLGASGTLHVKIDVDSPDLQNEILAGIPELEYWEQNCMVVSTGVSDVVNDPIVSLQWHLDTVNVLPAWEKTKGDGVVVGVIDTAFNNLLIHPELQSNIWTNSNEIPNNGIDDDHNGLIDDIHGWDFNKNEPDVSGIDLSNTASEHGTRVASVLGAISNNQYGGVGIAPNVQIIPIQAGDGNFAIESYVIAGINYLIQLKTNHKVNIRAINISLNGCYDRSLTQSLIAAGKAGITVIHAAGNDNKDTDTLSGAMYANDKNSDLENHITHVTQ